MIHFRFLAKGGLQIIMPSIQNKQELRILDPDLPILASEAAIDIDNLLANQTESTDAIRKLSAQMKNSIQIDPTSNAPRSLMDPATLSILGRIIAKSSRTPKTSMRIDQLLSEAVGIAELLGQDDLPKDRGELEKARDFCIALSRAAIAYRTSIRDMRIPPHPFRK